MKLTSSFLLLLLNMFASGQGIAIPSAILCNNQPAFKYSFEHDRDKECRATRQGRNFLIGDGAVAVVGGACFFLADHFHPPTESNPSGLGKEIFTGLCALEGTLFAVAGGGEFLAGKICDAHRRRSYSIVVHKNELGIAYNF